MPPSSPRDPSAPLKAAERVRDIRYAVRDVVVLADQLRREGRRMLWLNIGDPNIYDFKTPPQVVEAAVEAMRANHNGYAPSDGIEEALEAIGEDAARKGIRTPRYTWVGSGCSEVIDMALSALVDPGESVLTPAPGYPLYTALLSKLEAENRPYLLDEENGWQPDVDHMEELIDEKTRAIVVINPNNPTGSVSSKETLARIVELAKAHGLLLIADEIYDRLVFPGETYTSMGSLDPEAPVLTLGGLSKNWLAPGWRIGWGILSGVEEQLAPLREGIQKLGRARLSANHPEQHAIAPALRGEQPHLEDTMARLTRRTELAVEILNATDGISCVAPRGAFYAFPRLEGVADDAAWAADLMRQTGVVVVPGSGFGQKPGTSHFRIVTLPPEETIREACEAIRTYMAKG